MHSEINEALKRRNRRANVRDTTQEYLPDRISYKHNRSQIQSITLEFKKKKKTSKAQTATEHANPWI